MPGRKKDDKYTDALDSIFKTIFSSNYKPPRSRRPDRNMPGPDADIAAGALAAMALNPTLQLTEEAMNSLNTTMGQQELLKFHIDKGDEKHYANYDDNYGRFRVRVADAEKALTDPMSYADKIEEKAEEERKWLRLASLGGAIDSAIAASYGYKNGMTAKDAYQLGMTATGKYSDSMRAANHDLLAENIAMKSQSDLIRDELARDERYRGADKRTDLENALFERASKSKEDADRIASDLKQVMSSRDLDGALFTRNYKGQEELLNQRRELIRKGLMEINGKRPSGERYDVDTVLKNFDSEIKSQFLGDNSAGYRVNLYRNYHNRMMFSDNPDEIRKLARAKGVTEVWHRIKGSKEYMASQSVSESLKEIGKEIKRIEGLENMSAADQAYLAQLQQQQGRFQEIENNFNMRMWGQSETARNLGIKDESAQPWRSPTSSFERSLSEKDRSRAINASIDFQISKLEHQISEAGDVPGRLAQLNFELEGLRRMKGGFDRTPGLDARIRLSNGMNIYRELQGNVYQSGLVAGLPFFAYGWQSTGAFGPVQNMKVKVKGDDGIERYMSYYSDSRKGIEGLKDVDGPAIVLPRDDIRPAQAALTNLYYITPGSLMKTLFYNGEGFAYLSERRLRKLQDRLYFDRESPLTHFLLANRGNPLYSEYFIDGEIDYTKVTLDYLELFDKITNSDSEIPESLKKLINQYSKQHGRIIKLKDYAYRLGSPQRFIAKLVAGGNTMLKRMLDRATGRDNATLAFQTWLKSRFQSDVWANTVEQFFAKSIGVRQLVREATKQVIFGLLKKIGVATSGTGVGILIYIVTTFVEKVGLKIVKYTFGISIVALWGLVAVICALLFFLSSSLLDRPTVAHNSIVPGQVDICATSLVPIGPPSGQGNPTPGQPPQDAICPIPKGSYCTQGPFNSVSHGPMGTFAVDVSTYGAWVAPTDGVVTRASHNVECDWEAGKNAGGIVNFVDNAGNEYRMLHVDPLVPVGTAVSQGDIIAVPSSGLPKSKCWTGLHYHLDTKSGGGWVNSEEWYNGLGCNLTTCP